MARTLSFRIAFAFVLLALATWISVGGALFLVLRGLHSDATAATLIDVAAPLVAQVRPRLVAGADVQTVLSDLRDQIVDSGYSVYIVAAGGRVVALQGDPVPPDTIQLDANAIRGETGHGTFRTSTGQVYAWAAVTLRNPGVAGPGVAGPRALVLATPDRSGADALRNLVNAFPAVVIVTLLVGIPITWLLSRSVTSPLRRLASATADLPRGAAPALPIEGPTEIRELTARFNAMTEELRETRRSESELLANLRHDLRTPVTVIAGFAEALTDGTATGDDIERAARAIREEAERLEHLVGELGAVERLQSGAAGLRPEGIVAADVLAQTAERFRRQATGQGVEITVVPEAPTGSGGPNRPLVVAADRLAVERILANLTANALAALSRSPASSPAPEGHSSADPLPIRGHIWLSARRLPAGWLRDAPTAEAVVLGATDDGPGFGPGMTERVFERFYRADPSRTGTGSGLGLAIVRELARAHGGDAIAENVAPHGARLSVILPALPGQAVPGQPPRAVPAS
ncbi:MAG TPA: ATP-binding protein [Candidatus Saccharimonadales bacterium]|nr:ATP-binding protein [Candidatus Saccharimonadales bacterium]